VHVIWTQPALNGINFAYEYLVDFNPRAARKVVEGLRAAGDSLEHFPNRGRPVPGTNMREIVTSYSYVIRYRVTGNTVVILRIRHTSRRPTVP
jgi:plasmid stabilization system protein ParE